MVLLYSRSAVTCVMCFSFFYFLHSSGVYVCHINSAGSCISLFFIFLGKFYKIGDVSALYLSDA